jgi:hypothetical protein
MKVEKPKVIGECEHPKAPWYVPIRYLWVLWLLGFLFIPVAHYVDCYIMTKHSPVEPLHYRGTNILFLGLLPIVAAPLLSRSSIRKRILLCMASVSIYFVVGVSFGIYWFLADYNKMARNRDLRETEGSSSNQAPKAIGAEAAPHPHR